nr:MAG TPA: hypothetical protein [Caudoviricetes sp.]
MKAPSVMLGASCRFDGAMRNGLYCGHGRKQ